MQFNIYAYISESLSSSNLQYSPEPYQGDRQRYYYLYVTTNLINNRFYVGMHQCTKSFDVRYKGSGKVLRRAIKKYGWESFECKPVAYFDNKLQASKAEQLVVTDELLFKLRGVIYNMKSGGTEGSINRQQSAMMHEKMCDPQYKQFWKEQVEFYKQHPDLAIVKNQGETPQQKQLRINAFSEYNKQRIWQEQQTEEYWIKRAQASKKIREKMATPLRVTNLQTGEVTEYPSLVVAQKAVGISLKALLRGSTKSPFAKLYKAEYINERDKQKVVPIRYKTDQERRDSHKKHCIPINAYDPFGNLVKTYDSFEQARRELGHKSTNFKAAIKHHYCLGGYYWDFAREQDRAKCVYKPRTRRRSIFACTLDGKPIHFFESVKDAAQFANCHAETLKLAIKEQRVYRDMLWRYTNNASDVKQTKSNLPDTAKRVGGSLEKNGPIVIEYDSAQVASKALNKCLSAVSSAIRQQYRCGGYYWRYID